MSVRKGVVVKMNCLNGLKSNRQKFHRISRGPPTLVEVGGQHGLFKHQRTAIEKFGPTWLIGTSGISSHANRFWKTRTAMNCICELLAADEPRLVVWFAFSEVCEQAAENSRSLGLPRKSRG